MLNPTGIQLPPVIDDSSQRNYEFDNLKTDRTSGIIAEATEGLRGSLLGQGFDIATNAAFDRFAPGKMLLPKDYEDSAYHRPGISFPHGVGENVARLKAADFDAQQERDATIQAMPDGVFSKLSQFAGGAIGFTAGTPLASTAAALLGRASTPIVAGLSKLGTAGAIAGYGVEGAVVAGGLTVPQELAHLANSNLYGDDYAPMEAIKSIGFNAGFGGLLHMGGAAVRQIKPFQLITKEADQVAKESAVSQMAEGKSVNVEPVINQGFADARRVDADAYNEELQNAGIELDGQISEKSAQLTEHSRILDESFREAAVAGDVEPSEHLSALDVARNTIEAEKIPEADRTVADNLFLNADTKTTEMISAISSLRKQASERSEADNSRLLSLEKGNENTLIEGRISRTNDRIEAIEQALTETKSNAKIEKLTAERELLHKRRARDEIRLNALEKPKRTSFSEQQKKVTALRQELADLRETKRNHDIALAALTKPVEPVTKQAVVDHMAKMDSVDSDSAIDTSEVKATEREAQAIPDDMREMFNDFEERVNELEKNGRLNEAEKATLEEARNYESVAKRLRAVFKSAIDCLAKK